MELRKCCNHPFLIHGVERSEASKRTDGVISSDERTAVSGKMVLLSKLLPKLRTEGHRVLIFTQFVMVLDVLAEMLELNNYSFERLDGTIRADLRQVRIREGEGAHAKSTQAQATPTLRHASRVCLSSSPSLYTPLSLCGTGRHRSVLQAVFNHIRLPTLDTSGRCRSESHRGRHGHHLRLRLEPAE